MIAISNEFSFLLSKFLINYTGCGESFKMMPHEQPLNTVSSSLPTLFATKKYHFLNFFYYFELTIGFKRYNQYSKISI